MSSGQGGTGPVITRAASDMGVADQATQRTGPVGTAGSSHSARPTPYPVEDAGAPNPSRVPGPRSWNQGEERQMLYGMLFFLGLGVYAAAFVVLGVWLSP